MSYKVVRLGWWCSLSAVQQWEFSEWISAVKCVRILFRLRSLPIHWWISSLYLFVQKGFGSPGGFPVGRRGRSGFFSCAALPFCFQKPDSLHIRSPMQTASLLLPISKPNIRLRMWRQVGWECTCELRRERAVCKNGDIAKFSLGASCKDIGCFIGIRKYSNVERG